MNAKDRKYLSRLYGVVSRFPWPNRSHTLGPSELSEFFSNMEELQPAIMRCIMAIARSDSPDEDPEHELQELEELLVQLEKSE